MKKIISLVLAIGGILSVSATDMAAVFNATRVVEIYHTPFYDTSIIASSPEDLRRNATWVFSYRDWRAIRFQKGLPERIIAYLDKAVSYDCQWSIVFKDSKGVVLSEINFNALSGEGEFNGQPCRVEPALIIKMNDFAKMINPRDDLTRILPQE